MLNLAKFCKDKGMTLEEYRTLKDNLIKTCKAIIQQIPEEMKDNGMYYPINELINYNTNTEIKPYMIQIFKSLGVEFIDNCTLWRY